MNKERMIYLVQQYCARQLSDAERGELSHALHQEDETFLLPVLATMAELEAQTPQATAMETLRPAIDAVLAIDKAVIARRPVSRLHPLRWAAAAVVMLAAGAGIYFYQQHTARQAAVVQHITPTDIRPGSNGAILTLMNGEKVVLDSMPAGVVANQQGKQLVLQGGHLSYNGAMGEAGDAGFNTVTTPAGRQFQLYLPDGTTVWLNAASSIRYPVNFKDQRSVTVTGEAYFDVAQDATKPFVVQLSPTLSVQVLGTAFNVNTYEADAIKTTLIQGRVKVTGSDALLLKPGEQAMAVASGALVLHKNISVAQEIAWKNGFFDFNGRHLTDIAGELSRWYDIDVVYEPGVKNVELYGKINRAVNLADLLKLLTATGAHFRMEGRKLIVTP